MNIKNFLMNGVAFAPDDEKGAAEKTASQLAQETRDTIKSTVVKEPDDDKPEPSDDDNVDDQTEVDKEEDKEEEKEEVETESKEEVEAKADDPEKLKRTIVRLQKRLDKETGSKKDLKRDLEAAQKKLEDTGEERLTKDDVEKEAKRIASETLIKQDFERACKKLNKDALAVDKKFDEKVGVMAEEIGPIPSQMIAILEDLDNGGAVLAHLTDNVEDAEEIYALSPAKMALRLSKISDKLAASAKPKKPISQVPPPNEPIGGGAVTPNPLTNPKASTKDWIEARNKDVAAKRAAGRYNLR